MPILNEISLNNQNFTENYYISRWTNIASSSYFTVTTYSSVNCDVVVEYSIDGIQVIDTETEVLVGGNLISISKNVKSSFIRVSIINIASTPADLKLQGFFFLTNQNEEKATLTSAGGTISLVNDGIGPTLAIKGLTEGNGISLVDEGTQVTINSTSSSIWQEVSGTIRPISSNSNGLLCGITSGSGANILEGPIQAVVVGGSNNIAANTRNIVIGGTGNRSGVSGDQTPTDSVVVGGTNNYIRSSGIGPNNVICGGTFNDMFNNNLTNNFIGGGNQNVINGNNAISCALIGGDNNTARRLRNVVIGGNNNTVGNTGNQTPTDSVVIGGTNNSITSSGIGPNNVICGGSTHSMVNNNLTNNFIAGGNGSVINTNDSSNNIVLGSNITANGSGSFVFSDNAGGERLSTGGSNRFRVRCNGGASFFTDTTNTVGVSLAGSGGSSWTVISDVNKKENLEELNYSNILEKIDSLPIYKFNYIGVEKERICYGPIAQEWYDPSRFMCENIEVPVMVSVTKPCLDENGDTILDKDGNPINSVDEVQAVDEEGNLQFKMVPSKDNLSIETGDLIGISLACEKELITIYKKQQKMIKDLQDRLALIESRIFG